MHNRRFVLLLAVVLCAWSCGDRAPDSPAAATRLALRSLDRGAPLPAYRALPPRWRRDVQALVTRAIGAVDPEAWDDIGKGIGFLADGIRRYPEVILPLPIPSEEDRIPVLRILVALEEHFDDAGVLRHEVARSLDVDRFLDDPGDEVLPLLVDLAGRTRPCPEWADVHEVFRSLGVLRPDAASAEMDEAGPPGDDGIATLVIRFGDGRHEVPFTQVEGRWVPQVLAVAWDPGFAAADAALDAWIIRWTENREVVRIRAESFRIAAEHFAATGDISALLTTLPPL